MLNLSGYHAGGANSLMCDGSVRFLKNSTDQPVVWALGTRAQGEVNRSESLPALIRAVARTSHLGRLLPCNLGVA